MSIYHRENPEYFNGAMVSIWDRQTIKPDEIILVEDGKLTPEIYEIIDIWRERCGSAFITIPLEENIGLGDALNIGLQRCKYERVARMDTDDIASPNRFERQLEVFDTLDIDVCGGWVSEFDKDEKDIVSYRKLPEFHQDIISFAKLRNPINHPTAMYNKSSIIEAGNYQKMLWFEDYYLWARMIQNGAKFYNIQDTLVNMRAGYGQLQRRGGVKYAIEEYKFEKKLLDIEFITLKEFLRNIFIRFVARVIPQELRRNIYKILRK
jgi:glycosyltransferase involved in cell wall biosynthesis